MDSLVNKAEDKTDLNHLGNPLGAATGALGGVTGALGGVAGTVSNAAAGVPVR